MKKTFKALLSTAAAVLMLASSIAVSAAYKPVEDVNVPYATPTIDGKFEKDEWPAEGKILLSKDNTLWKRNGGAIPDSWKAEYYYAWDETYLYIGGIVLDENFSHSADAVNYASGDSFQQRLNLGGVVNEGANGGPYYSFGSTADGIVTVVLQASAGDRNYEKVGNSAKNDKGWQFELKLEWKNLVEDAKKMANKDVKVEAGLQILSQVLYIDCPSRASYITVNSPTWTSDDLFNDTFKLILTAKAGGAKVEETKAEETKPEAAATGKFYINETFDPECTLWTEGNALECLSSKTEAGRGNYSYIDNSNRCLAKTNASEEIKSGVVTFEIDYKISSEGTQRRIYWEKSNGFGLYINTNSINLVDADGRTQIKGAEIADHADKWHTLKVVTDIDNATNTVYVDGVKYLEGKVAVGDGVDVWLQKLVIRTESSDMSFDNVKMYTEGAVEETKTEETKAQETKAEETKAQETKAQETVKTEDKAPQTADAISFAVAALILSAGAAVVISKKKA